jgi:copper(I)-binding protein
LRNDIKLTEVNAMKHIVKRHVALFRSSVLPTLVLWMLLVTLAACASDATRADGIQVVDPWARPAVALKGAEGASADQSMASGMSQGQGGTGAIFMRLVNEGHEADRLVSVQTDAAQVAEIHETRIEGDVMRMQLLPDGLEIPAGGEVVLEPGGYHIMLIELNHDMKVGDTVAVALEFEKNDTIQVQVPVR